MRRSGFPAAALLAMVGASANAEASVPWAILLVEELKGGESADYIQVKAVTHDGMTPHGDHRLTEYGTVDGVRKTTQDLSLREARSDSGTIAFLVPQKHSGWSGVQNADMYDVDLYTDCIKLKNENGSVVVIINEAPNSEKSEGDGIVVAQVHPSLQEHGKKECNVGQDASTLSASDNGSMKVRLAGGRHSATLSLYQLPPNFFSSDELNEVKGKVVVDARGGGGGFIHPSVRQTTEEELFGSGKTRRRGRWPLRMF